MRVTSALGRVMRYTALRANAGQSRRTYAHEVTKMSDKETSNNTAEEERERIEGACELIRAFKAPEAFERASQGGTDDLVKHEEGIYATENYLSGYKFCRRMLNLKNYEKRYVETLEWERSFPTELTLAKAKMFEIRHFVLSLPNSDEKMMLYFHYIKCETIERSGEMLGVSRSTAFRLKRRALEMAYATAVKQNNPLRVF